MSLNEEFDELARRKLEGRQFPFQEADWQAARSLIDAQRRRRDRAAWIFGAGMLLLISGLTWYGTRPATEVANTAVVGQEQVKQAQQGPAESATAIALNATSRTTSSTIAPTANTVNASATAENPMNAETKAEANASVVNSVEATPRARNVAHHPATATHIPMHEPDHAVATMVPASEREPRTAASISATSAAAGQDTPLALSAASSERPGGGEVMGSDAHQVGDLPPASPPTPGDQQAAPPKDREAVDAVPPPLPMGIAATPEVTLTATPQALTNVASPGSDAPISQDATSSPAAATTGADQPVADATPPPMDNAPATQVADANGSAAAAPPAPEAAPPIVPEKAPWEISILGGVFSSKTDYSGSNSADWKGDISKERSISVGAEFMHMGRNIGIGAGLHYGSYAERLRSDAIDHTTTSTENYWYLLPVDTTFLFITDTLPGQPPTYTGTPVDTTVNVLTQGTHTTTSTERLREARDQVNRVSYLEVPLLIDAHLVQGRWSFGLRGGPTFGLLTATRGSVPNVDNEGYVEFSDLPFREFILGYTARAYARYRFNAAWSVGIEPAIRGQLMNSLDGGDLERRVSSKGVLISLSYRLR